MNRSFGCAMLVAAGIVLGYAVSSHETSNAAPPAEGAAAEGAMIELADQLKEVKKQVTEINDLLHNGTIKVVVILNPDSK